VWLAGPFGPDADMLTLSLHRGDVGCDVSGLKTYGVQIAPESNSVASSSGGGYTAFVPAGSGGAGVNWAVILDH
jgi:hypothetical protein